MREREKGRGREKERGRESESKLYKKEEEGWSLAFNDPSMTLLGHHINYLFFFKFTSPLVQSSRNL